MSKPRIRSLLLAALVSLASPGFAQTLQSTPNVSIVSNGFVFALAAMPDGDWIVGGEFDSVNGVARKNLARINADGSVDAAWNPGADASVRAIAITTGGDVFIGGWFQHVAGMPRAGLAKITAAGVLAVWQAGVGADFINALAIDGSGRLLVAGQLGDFPAISYLKRLSPSTGTVDPGFVGLPDSHVEQIALTANGDLLVAGGFTQISGVARRGVARLDLDGLPRANWNAAADGPVSAMAVGSGDTLYVAGFFSQIGGAARSGLAKLDANGQADPDWHPQGPDGGTATLEIDGNRLYVGGAFEEIAGGVCPNLARLDAFGSGALDATWTASIDGPVGNIGLPPSGEIWLGGEFLHVGTALRMGLARLDAAGTPAAASDAELPGTVTRIEPVAGGAVVIGNFLKIDGAAHARIARLTTAGALDPAFVANVEGTIFALSSDATHLYIGGTFTAVNGVARNRLAKLELGSGTLDPTWTPVVDGNLRALHRDGATLYAAGDFTQVNGVARSGLAKLATAGSGTLDTGFDAGLNAAAKDVRDGGGGRLLLLGYFTQVGASARRYVGMVSASTGAALAFDAGLPSGNFPVAAAMDGSGRVYLTGSLQSAQGTSLCGLARFDGGSGALDTRWRPRATGPIQPLAVIGNAVYVGGSFTALSGVPRVSLAKLPLTSPFPESTWRADVGVISSGDAIQTIAPIGTSVWVGGLFSSIGGTARSSLAALTTGVETLFGDAFEDLPSACDLGPA